MLLVFTMKTVNDDLKSLKEKMESFWPKKLSHWWNKIRSWIPSNWRIFESNLLDIESIFQN